jgi:hypothetical protein
MDSRNQLNLPKNGWLFPLSPGSRHYGTPQTYTVKQSDSLAQLIPKRQKLGLRHRVYLYGAGILTGFPFDLLS